jgi:hypothetical protein
VGPCTSSRCRTALQTCSGRDVDAGEGVELAGDHEHRDAGEVADEHRPGEQVGEEAQAERPPEHAEQAGDDGEGGRERGVAVGSAHPDGGDGGGGHQGGRRLRADGELARGAEHGVDEGRRDDREQSGGRGEPGDLGVGHHLGDEVGGDRHPGEDVPAQPAALVVAQHRQAREGRGERGPAPLRERPVVTVGGGHGPSDHSDTACRLGFPQVEHVFG